MKKLTYFSKVDKKFHIKKLIDVVITILQIHYYNFKNIILLEKFMNIKNL